MSYRLRIHGPSKHGTYGVSDSADVMQDLISTGSSEDEAVRLAIEAIAASDKVDVSQVMIWRVPGNLPFPKDTFPCNDGISDAEIQSSINKLVSAYRDTFGLEPDNVTAMAIRASAKRVAWRQPFRWVDDGGCRKLEFDW